MIDLHRIAPAAAVGLLVCGLSGAAEAASTVQRANMYAGPGGGYAVVTTVPAGAYVALGGCDRGWCQASYGRWSGYLHVAYLAGAGAPATGTNLRTSTGGTVRLENRGSPPALGLIMQGGGVKKKQQLNNRAIPLELRDPF